MERRYDVIITGGETARITAAVQMEIDRVWAEEVERRNKDIESGKAKLVSGEEVFRKIRKKYYD